MIKRQQPLNPLLPRYDLNFKKFYDWGNMSESGHPEENLFRAEDGECRLGRYLLPRDLLIANYVGQNLARFRTGDSFYVEEILGKIVSIETEFGYWVVTNGEDIDIFRGETSIRPVRLES